MLSRLAVYTYMSAVRLIFSLVFLEDAQLLEPLACHARLLELALSLAILSVLVQNQQEILRDEL